MERKKVPGNDPGVKTVLSKLHFFCVQEACPRRQNYEGALWQGETALTLFIRVTAEEC